MRRELAPAPVGTSSPSHLAAIASLPWRTVALVLTTLATLAAAGPAAAAAPCRDSVATPCRSRRRADGGGRPRRAAVAPRRSASISSRRRSRTRPASRTRCSRSATLRSVVLNGRVDGRPSGPRRRCCPTRGSSSGAPASASGRSSRSTSRISAAASRRSRSTSTPRPTTGRSGTSARTSSTTPRRRAGHVGTWLAGKEGPAAMIMPAAPRGRRRQPRREHPRLVWEEVDGQAVGRTVAGPRGPVARRDRRPGAP